MIVISRPILLTVSIAGILPALALAAYILYSTEGRRGYWPMGFPGIWIHTYAPWVVLISAVLFVVGLIGLTSASMSGNTKKQLSQVPGILETFEHHEIVQKIFFETESENCAILLEKQTIGPTLMILIHAQSDTVRGMVDDILSSVPVIDEVVGPTATEGQSRSATAYTIDASPSELADFVTSFFVDVCGLEESDEVLVRGRADGRDSKA